MKSFKWLFWTLLFFLMFLAIDQLLVRVPPLHPAHGALSHFYQDFRSRLFDLIFDRGNLPPRPVVVKPLKPVSKGPSAAKTMADKAPRKDQPSIETVIKEKSPQASSGSQSDRYIYSDSAGVLQFADSLEEVPPQFREQAQKL